MRPKLLLGSGMAVQNRLDGAPPIRTWRMPCGQAVLRVRRLDRRYKIRDKMVRDYLAFEAGGLA